VADTSKTPVRTATKVFVIDRNGNNLNTLDYDWAPYGSTNPPLVRQTSSSYWASTSNALSPPSSDEFTGYWNSSLGFQIITRNSVSNNLIGDSASNYLAYTEFAYDNGLTTANPLQERKWDSTKSPTLPQPLTPSTASVTTHVYNANGQVTQVTDPIGNITTYTYGPVNGYTNFTSVR
jgi:RHS Repeat